MDCHGKTKVGKKRTEVGYTKDLREGRGGRYIQGVEGGVRLRRTLGGWEEKWSD